MAAGLDQPGSRVSLAEAALRVAAEEYPNLDVSAWLGRLDALGDAVRGRDELRHAVVHGGPIGAVEPGEQMPQ